MIGSVKNKNCLLLQGPMGPFFRKLDKELRRRGANVHRICFNGGDFLYANKDNCRNFTGTPEKWPFFIARFLKKHRIQMIFLYGDCRYYHKQAKLAAAGLGIDVYVFEEGYVRPNFITLEKGGVNAHSSMPAEADDYRNDTPSKPVVHNQDVGRYAFQNWTLCTIAYYVAMRLLFWYYPGYRHHRDDSVLKEAFYGIRNGCRKIAHGIVERNLAAFISTKLTKRYFFVPLQTIGDFQISEYSPFVDMKDFIGVVMRSFAVHAPKDLFLIIKHHPLDRGRVNYNAHIRKAAKSLGIADRVLSIHDVHLPTCLMHAIGTVTVNSTVGIASLFHETPTIVLGKALYDIDGLTCKGMALERFWTRCRTPEKQLFNRFRARLIEQTQCKGSFYSGFPGTLFKSV